MREHAAVTTYDQLVAIVRRADLTAAVVTLDGPFARRLDAELRFYREIRGPWATQSGEVQHLVRVSALKGPFDRDVKTLLGGLPFD
jgi:hypothetical protein